MKYNPKLRRKLRHTKAYNNNTFLNSRDARSIRVQCELVEPELRLKQLGVDHTVTFFGSARTKIDTPDYASAYKLAYRIGDHKKFQDNMAICSGGGPGTMEAVNAGAMDSGAKSMGMGISLPFEQFNNEHITTDLDFEFHYFFTRKYWCVYLGKAFVVLPGGVGTMDELFEVLTLIQTGKISNTRPIVLFNKDFWEKTINFDRMVEQGTISKSDLDLFHITDDIQDAVNYIYDNIKLDR
jgi:uncharacterized protein (TIGR00730 family)